MNWEYIVRRTAGKIVGIHTVPVAMPVDEASYPKLFHGQIVRYNDEMVQISTPMGSSILFLHWIVSVFETGGGEDLLASRCESCDILNDIVGRASMVFTLPIESKITSLKASESVCGHVEQVDRDGIVLFDALNDVRSYHLMHQVVAIFSFR